MSQQRQRQSIPKLLLIGTAFGYAAHKIEPTSTEMLWLDGICMVVSALAAWGIVKEVPWRIYNWLLRRRAKHATDNHGAAQWADKEAIMSYGLHAAIGLFLAVSIYTGAPMFHRGEGHWMVYAPTRSGKSRCLVLTNILHCGTLPTLKENSGMSQVMLVGRYKKMLYTALIPQA